MADRTISVRLKAESSQYMASMRAAGKATKELESAHSGLTKALDKEADAQGQLSLNQKRLSELEKSGTATAYQLAEARENVAMATRKYEAAQEDVRKSAVRYSEALKQNEEDNKNFGDSLRNVDRIAKRTQLSFKALMGALAVGLPAASVAAYGAAIAGVAAGFAALGGFALRNNEEVRQSFIALKDELNTGLAQDASVMVDDLVSGADLIGDRYQALRPQMRAAFEGAGEQIEPLIDSVFDLAESAFPGLLDALDNAGPAMDGFGEMMARTGSGLSDLFSDAADSTEDVGRGLENLGSLLQGTLGETGDLLSVLSSAWAEHGDEVSDVIVRIIGVLGDLTGSALPILSTVAGQALNMLSGLLSAIEPLTGVLGPAIASWLALAGAIKTVNGVANVVSSLGNKMTTFGESSRKGATVAAVALLGIGAAAQAILGQVGEFTASASELEKGLNSLAKTGKATGEAARIFGEDLSGLSEAVGLLTEGGIGQWSREVSENIANLVGASGELGDAEEKLESFDTALASMVESGNQDKAFQLLQTAAQRAGISVDELKGKLPGYTEALKAAKEAAKELGTTAMQSQPGIKQLEESLAVLKEETSSTADKVDALNSAWRRLFGVALSMEEANAAFEEGLDNIADATDEAKKAGSGWRKELVNANGAINVTTEAGRQLSENLIQQGDDYRALAQSAYDSALKQNKSQSQATQAAVDAVTKRRRQFRREMEDLGYTEDQARKLANRYLGMPNDVITAIRTPGMLSALSNARSLLGTINSFPPVVQTVVQAVMPGAAWAALNMMGGMADGGYVGRYADGGQIPRFASGGGAYQDHPQGRLHGPGGPRSDSILARVANGEFVSTAMSTAMNGEALEAGNRGARLVALPPGAQSFADGGSVTGQIIGSPRSAVSSGGLSITVNAPNYVGNVSELMTAVRKQVSTKYGGDVNRALGRN